MSDEPDDLWESPVRADPFRASPVLPPWGKTVGRDVVLAALERWALGTKASQIGRTWGVTRAETRREMAEYLLDGPVGAALEAVGVTVE